MQSMRACHWHIARRRVLQDTHIEHVQTVREVVRRLLICCAPKFLLEGDRVPQVEEGSVESRRWAGHSRGFPSDKLLNIFAVFGIANILRLQ